MDVKRKNKFTINGIKLIPDQWKKFYFSCLDPVIDLFGRLKLNPNFLTILGFGVSCVAAFFVVRGQLLLGGLLILFAGLFDSIDGKLARASNKVTHFGALFDSTIDRYSEVIFFIAIAYNFITNGWYWSSLAVAIGLTGSLMVSYVRARAEGLGFQCTIGLLQRPERIILLGFGALVGSLIHIYIFIFIIWLIAILSNMTAIQRMVHIWNQDKP